MTQTHAVTTPGPSFETVVAATLIGSALVHATVVEEHLAEWTPAGVFFLLLVAGETLLGVAALRVWSRPLAWLVAGSSLLTVATWTVSRTTGMPLGPADFRVPEAVGLPDLACCGLELVAAAVAVWSLRHPLGHPVAPPRPLVVAAVLAAVVVTVTATAPALRGGHDAHHDHASAAATTR